MVRADLPDARRKAALFIEHSALLPQMWALNSVHMEYVNREDPPYGTQRFLDTVVTATIVATIAIEHNCPFLYAGCFVLGRLRVPRISLSLALATTPCLAVRSWWCTTHIPRSISGL
jgi:hypothetical protein